MAAIALRRVLAGILPAAVVLLALPSVRAAEEAAAKSPWDSAVAVFDYAVRDMDAAVRFYRDGIGMQEVRTPQGERLFTYAGGCLHLRPAKEAKPPPAAPGNPLQQIMAANGYRYISLFLHDVAAAEARLVQAGYPRPMKGGRVSMTRDPDGNVVEFVPRPPEAGPELFTVGVIVADEKASRAFYGERLGLPAERPMRLPAPMEGKMIHPFSVGPARVKLFQPDGERPRDAHPQAPGLKGLTILVPDPEAVRQDLARRGLALESLDTAPEETAALTTRDPDGIPIQVAAKGALVLPASPAPPASAGAGQPDGGRTQDDSGRGQAGGASARTALARFDRNGDGTVDRDEFKASRFGQQRPELFDGLDRNRDGRITAGELGILAGSGPTGSRIPTVPLGPPAPQIDETQPTAPGEPPLRRPPTGDASDDARGRGQLFESIVVPGFTDIVEGTNGIALADLNRDGLTDIVATYSPPRGTGGAWGEGERLRVFLNEGEFRFREHAVRLLESKVTPDRFGRGQVPNLADFNGDGFFDLVVTRHAQMSGGRSNPRDQKIGNGLYVTEGAWDVFRDVSAAMGIRNEEAYNRQPCIGDVNGDGWLDIAIGCDNIKNAMGGVPHSRLYVFKANGDRFLDGRFEDIGGTDLVPDFGGFYHDSARDKAGPDINLVDLDNDGDLDLVQGCHVDVREPLLPYWPGEYRQGVFCWKNLLAETGALRFEKVGDNGLACEARLRYNREKQVYEPAGDARAPGLPYISFADVDNDGLMDVLAVGPASPGWAPRTEYVGGRFWRNAGGFTFTEATEQSGFGPLNWPMRQWLAFYEEPQPEVWQTLQVRASGRGYPSQPGLPRQDPAEAIPYFADAVLADFDNDGWIDAVVMDRSESTRRQARATLFMNRGDGTFECKPTTFSGLDSPGITAEAADLNGDGLVDLVVAADPDNSGVALTPDRYQDKVYWNTGLDGARENHWLRLRFSGVSDAELIGARVELAAGGKTQCRWIHGNPSYKSGGALDAHFGLGKATAADVKVTLLDGRIRGFPRLNADQTRNLEFKEEGDE